MKGDKESNGLIENAVMLLRGIIRTIKCHIESSSQEPLSDESPVLPWLVKHAGCILSRCQKGRDGRTPFERLHGKKPTQEFVPLGDKVLAEQITTDPMNRMISGTCTGLGLECETRAQNVSLGMQSGKWKVDRPEGRVDSIPIPPLSFEGARIQRERITKQDIDEFGATIGCQGCNAIKDNKRTQAHSDRCRRKIEECLRVTPHGPERSDRRKEVINEALAEEVQ